MNDNKGKGTSLSRADFASDQEVRWCPGCGDYSILAQVQKTLPKLNLPREKHLFISGIGCSSRFPYYMETYGMHSIHGRAPAIATGVNLTNPDLMVWVITGDGDGLSIGGNHLAHIMRRNVNVNIILFNNRIYGLTKGQYSPTSVQGQKTKSSPYGTIDNPINPLSFALSAEATFIARSFDVNTRHLASMIETMAHHKGVSFLEVFQNCNIFNDGAFSTFTDKEVRDDQCLYLEHGQPLVFGKDQKKGIRLQGLTPEVVTIGEKGITEEDLLFHDEKAHPAYVSYLAQMAPPEFPMPLGVIRKVEKPAYHELMENQIEEVKKVKGEGNLKKLLHKGDTWVVK